MLNRVSKYLLTFSALVDILYGTIATTSPTTSPTCITTGGPNIQCGTIDDCSCGLIQCTQCLGFECVTPSSCGDTNIILTGVVTGGLVVRCFGDQSCVDSHFVRGTAVSKFMCEGTQSCLRVSGELFGADVCINMYCILMYIYVQISISDIICNIL